MRTLRRLAAGLAVSTLLLAPTGVAWAGSAHNMLKGFTANGAAATTATVNTMNISTTTLPVGTTTTGSVADRNATQATITLNRTGSGSHPWLNTLGSDTNFTVQIQSSPDGTTWNDEAAATTQGGQFVNFKTGQVETTWVMGVSGLAPGTSVRAVITVTGPSPVTISGSISTS